MAANKSKHGASFNLLQPQRLPRRAQVDTTAGKALSSRVRLPVLEFVFSLQTGAPLPSGCPGCGVRRGQEVTEGGVRERKHGTRGTSPSTLPSFHPVYTAALAPRAHQRAARITLPAGRAGSADGGPGQASLPALPKGRASGQLLESQRGIGSGYLWDLK